MDAVDLEHQIEINQRYNTAIFAWQRALGGSMDMTPEQLRRFRAFEKAGGDVARARLLLFCWWLVRNGKVRR